MNPGELLLPRPQRLELSNEELELHPKLRIVSSTAASAAAEGLRRELETLGFEAWVGGVEAPDGSTLIRLALDAEEPQGEQGYRLAIEPHGIDLVSAGPAGLFHGSMTLCQWLRLENRSSDAPHEGLRRVRRLPKVRCVEIIDAPDLAMRGFLLDISRNRVPRLDTLFELIDLLASLKFNQLQLYTEHTFAYRGHDRVWENASPLTESDLREIDTYCRHRFIELVPNQNSFGHFHRWLVHEPYRALAERPDGVAHPFGSSKEPFSLCPTDPASLELMEDLFEQLLPNFSSRQVNVGLDETFDLGTGRSSEACEAQGKEEVYLEYLLKIHELVGSWGRRMQFWGDIILERPDLIEKLPEDVVALDWGYEADHPFDAECQAFAAAGRDFYVCPGTSSWSSFGGRLDNAVTNLANAARAGVKHGAEGLLITDWGDFGHLQPQPVSYPGILAGAAFAWRSEDAQTPEDFPLRELIPAHFPELSEAARVHALLTLGTVHLETGAPLKNSTVLFRLIIHADETLEHERFDSLTEGGLERAAKALRTIDLPKAPQEHPLTVRELDWVRRLLLFATRLGRVRIQAGRTAHLDELPETERRSLAADLEQMIEELPELWLARSRPGGLEESREYLVRVVRELAAGSPSQGCARQPRS